MELEKEPGTSQSKVIRRFTLKFEFGQLGVPEIPKYKHKNIKFDVKLFQITP